MAKSHELAHLYLADKKKPHLLKSEAPSLNTCQTKEERQNNANLTPNQESFVF